MGRDGAMQPQTLKFKVVLYLTIALAVAMLLFTGLVAWFLYNEILGKVSDHVIQLSEVISQKHALRHAAKPARLCRPDHPRRGQSGEHRPGQDPQQRRDASPIRPTRPKSGRPVDRKAEACSHCIRANGHSDNSHGNSGPGRSRAPNGQSLLGSMEVIRNEPSCYNAACHQHSKRHIRPRRARHRLFARHDQSKVARQHARDRRLFLWIHPDCLAVGRLLRAPPGLSAAARPRERGATDSSAGNLDQPIPVRSARRIRQACLRRSTA